MAIEGLRQMERHGGAVMLERAFDGFAALPPPEDCWSVLGLAHIPRVNIGRATITNAFQNKAREAHAKGDDVHRIVLARDKALEQIGA